MLTFAWICAWSHGLAGSQPRASSLSLLISLKAVRDDGVSPAEARPLTQSWSPLTPPRSRLPVVELSLIGPQVSEIRTNLPFKVVVTVPLEYSYRPALFVKSFGAEKPVFANGIG